MLIKVCSLDVLPSGEMKQFNVKDYEILVVNLHGQFFCFDARCTHAGAPLAEGTLNGDVLTCPWHGSQFRITDGKVIRGPTEKELKIYVSKVLDNGVFIDV